MVASGSGNSGSGGEVTLRGVHVRARVVDAVGKVVILQEYSNSHEEPVEAKYIFPLDELSAVVGFEAAAEEFLKDMAAQGCTLCTCAEVAAL